MQSFRTMHALRGVMRPGRHPVPKTVVTQEAKNIFHFRFYGEEASQQKRRNTSKEERRALIISFVEKYKALHEGKFPATTLVREEVGGAYNTVKDILQDLLKVQSSNTHEESDALETSTVDVALKTDKDESADPYPTVLNTEKNENGGAGVNEVDSAGELVLASSETSESQMTDLKVPTVSLTDSYSTVLDEGCIDEMSTEQNKGVAEKLSSKPHSFAKDEVSSPKSGTSDSQNLQMRLPQEGRAQAKGLQSKELLKFCSKLGSKQNTQALEDSDEESENDPDFSAPEYSATDGIKKIRAALARSRESASTLKHELFISQLPLLATQADLINAFKDCGQIVKAQVFPCLQAGARFTFGSLQFRTEQGLNAARMKEKVFIKNVEVQIQGNLAKEVQMKKYPTPGFSSPAKTENSRNLEISSQRGPSLPMSVSKSPQNLYTEKLKTPPGILPKTEISQITKNTGGFKVIVYNTSPKIKASEVREVMSENGEIIAVEERYVNESTVSHIIHFKTRAAQRAALVRKHLFSNGTFCQVQQIGDPETTVVRVSNLPSDWTENELRFICQNMGATDVAIVPRGREVVDIYFDLREKKCMNKILLCLNISTVRGNLLQASLAPRFSENVQHVASAIGGEQLSTTPGRNNMLNAEVILQEMSELETCVQELNRSFHDLRELTNLRVQQLYSRSVVPS